MTAMSTDHDVSCTGSRGLPLSRSDAAGVEILAPAGDEDMLRAAVCSGADAVYLGLKGFNARRDAGNFTTQALQDAVLYCHARDVKVYVTLNTLVFEDELKDLADAVCTVARAGADGVITQDLATVELVKRIAPSLPLHASTQMTIHTPAGVREAARLGFARVILARELTLREIAALCDAGRESGVACEVFIHGALCFCVSGQCLLSAFLGARSGNRGVCAGPCRLPFDARPVLQELPGMPGSACHLSLKEMDHIPHLAALCEAGVSAIKIEGRQRGAEYVGVCVSACRAARNGVPYDDTLLRDTFSRSGFTDAYLTGRRDASMFGVRTKADQEASRAAAPKARALYQHEFARVAVDFTVNTEAICATDGVFTVAIPIREPFQPAQHAQTAEIERAIRKTGATPFWARSVSVDKDLEGCYLPAARWNALRREALEQLLCLRARPSEHPVTPCVLPDFPRQTKSPLLAARFDNWEQIPPDRIDSLAFLVLPLEDAQHVPARYRAKTVLALPRVTFGPAATDESILATLKVAVPLGFGGYVMNNQAHFVMANEAGASPLFGGMGLCVSNPIAADRYTHDPALGLQGLLIHPETPLPHYAAFGGFTTAALVYGYLPLMVSRACPMRAVHDCADCPHTGAVRDRKGRDFRITCSLPKNDLRTLYNPVPLYMGDRLREIQVDFTVAYFTKETQIQTAEILQKIESGAKFEGEFTRGLYYRRAL